MYRVTVTTGEPRELQPCPRCRGSNTDRGAVCARCGGYGVVWEVGCYDDGRACVTEIAHWRWKERARVWRCLACASQYPETVSPLEARYFRLLALETRAFRRYLAGRDHAARWRSLHAALEEAWNAWRVPIDRELLERTRRLAESERRRARDAAA